MDKLYILSGAPSSKEKDKSAIEEFVSLNGKKAVCGSTTLKIFCEITHASVRLKPESLIEGNPPQYEVEGLEFASEGILTLNAVFADLHKGEKKLPLSQLMLKAGEIIFITGGARNKLHDESFFRSSGVLPRDEIIDKIIRILEREGKPAAVIKEKGTGV
jgi:hypothetical protein